MEYSVDSLLWRNGQNLI